MKRSIFLMMLSSLYLFGMSYEAFKKETLKHTKILKAQEINAALAKVESARMLRPDNPSVQIDAARYRPDASRAGYGYSAMLSQPVRTPGFMRGVQAQSEANRALAQALTDKRRADFLKEFESYYTDYIYLNRLEALLRQESKLAKRTVSIAYARYKNGAADRVSYLRAKAAALQLATQRSTVEREIKSRYYTLLTLSGLKAPLRIPKMKFIYPVKLPKLIKHGKAPKTALYAAKQKEAASKLIQAETLVEKVNIYGGIEKEPDQSILRLGLSLPLPLLHQKKEERQLAKLRLQQLGIEQRQYENEIANTRQSLKASLSSLIHAYRENRQLVREQRSIVRLLQEGYKLSGEKLFELVSEQKRLIENQKSLLNLEKEINQLQITLRYIQGYYNE